MTTLKLVELGAALGVGERYLLGLWVATFNHETIGFRHEDRGVERVLVLGYLPNGNVG